MIGGVGGKPWLHSLIFDMFFSTYKYFYYTYLISFFFAFFKLQENY